MMHSFHGMSTEEPLAYIRDIFKMVSNMTLTERVTKELLDEGFSIHCERQSEDMIEFLEAWNLDELK